MTALLTQEMDALKTRLKTTWESGDYGQFAKYLETGALEFLSRIPINPGERVLDLACGAGQIAFAMARAGASVVGVDIAANLIEQAQARAGAEGLPVRFREADAEDLPCADGSWDMVISLIGAMFAPRPDRVIAEVLRVTKSGGRIVMANWTAQGFVGQMFKTLGRHIPPSPLMPSPMLWGDEATVRERFGAGVAELRLTKRLYPFRYPFGPAAVADHYHAFYGPINRAFASLDADGQDALHRDLTALWTAHNTAKDGTTAYESEYLEVVAVRA